ncbi:MAG: exopolyphosphatase [Spirochaetaceae bacterium]|nr:exopolyphosphatase [Spirochaetaceae bacterium]
MRLLTRQDFDGLACGSILEFLGIIDQWAFVTPADAQNGLVFATENDIVANIPYIQGCGIWFDHHSSEIERLGKKFFENERPLLIPTRGFVSPDMLIKNQKTWEVIKISYKSPSCARIVYDYYLKTGKDLSRFLNLLEYVDKVDSGNLTIDEILNPQGYVLLGFLVDSRTGLEKAQKYRTSSQDLIIRLSRVCSEYIEIEDILTLPYVKERVDAYNEYSAMYTELIKKHARVDGNVIVLDLRGMDAVCVGNRFLLYSIFNKQNISVVISERKKKCNISVGYSIICQGPRAEVNVGSLMLKYAGGGHRRVGSCEVPIKGSDEVIKDIIQSCKMKSAV